MEDVRRVVAECPPYKVRCPCAAVFEGTRASTRADGKVWLCCPTCGTWLTVTPARGAPR